MICGGSHGRYQFNEEEGCWEKASLLCVFLCDAGGLGFPCVNNSSQV